MRHYQMQKKLDSWEKHIEKIELWDKLSGLLFYLHPSNYLYYTQVAYYNIIKVFNFNQEANFYLKEIDNEAESQGRAIF